MADQRKVFLVAHGSHTVSGFPANVQIVLDVDGERKRECASGVTLLDATCKAINCALGFPNGKPDVAILNVMPAGECLKMPDVEFYAMAYLRFHNIDLVLKEE